MKNKNEKLNNHNDRQEIFVSNEDSANKLGLIYMSIAVVIMFAFDFIEYFFLHTVDSFVVNDRFMIAAFALVLFFIDFLIYKTIGHYKFWYKFIIITSIIIFNTCFASIYGANMEILMVIPIFLSCRYTSFKFSLFAIAMTLVAIIVHPYLSMYLYAIYNIGFVDLNDIELAEAATVNLGDSIYDIITTKKFDLARCFETIFMYRSIPTAFQTLCLAVVSLLITKSTYFLLFEQDKLTRKEEANKSELNFAKNIQQAMLPSVFPAFPEQKRFDIFASMDAAKDIGGDLFDFFMPDKDHLIIVIADVSGKGMPASLFMTKAKTLIRETAKRNTNPSFIFNNVNDSLCENNDMMLFVTGWIGNIDLNTLNLTYVNAGHNPSIYVKNNDSIYLNERSGPALAAMDGVNYKEFNIKLNHNDKILLYTDGVTESINKALEMYGEPRLLDFIKSHKDSTCSELVKNIKKDVDTYATGMDQFDDITLLCVDIK